MLKPVFILGVGAQKAGTTWLWNTLNEQPFSNMGFTKEYHVWDAKFSELGSRFRANVEKPYRAVIAMRRIMQIDETTYLKYFQSLIHQQVTLTGDITPSYAFLDESALRYIKDLVEKRGGFDLKVIFLLRDPVERVWSALGMQQRNLEKSDRPISGKQRENNFEHALTASGSRALTNYSETIKTLEKVFEPEQLHYEIYETLFSETAMTRLQEFIGRRFEIEPKFMERINDSKFSALPKKLRKMGEHAFADEYDFCAKRFPETTSLWSAKSAR